MIKIKLDRAQLIASLFTCPAKDIRHYLNGVFVEAGNAETRIMTTDGAAMACQRVNAYGDNLIETETGYISLILPRDTAENVRPNKTNFFVYVERDEAGKWALVDGAARYAFVPVDGRFPDYRRTIRSSAATLEAANISADDMAKFVRQAKALGCKFHGAPHINLIPSGQDAILVSLGIDGRFIGIAMPLKLKPVAQIDCQWVQERPPV